MEKGEYRKLAVVTIFAIAMAFLETVVVVYLRKLYYPGGFSLPLKGFIEPNILAIEWVREAFTIVMLLCIAILAAKKFYSRLAYFFYSFAVWDIFYYVWLKAVIGWPASFMTWDLLFLIPLPWIGPVLAPIIISLLLALFGLLILHFQDRVRNLKISLREWILLILGSIAVLYTFLYDYALLIVTNGFAKSFFTLATNTKFIDIVSAYNPKSYNWILFVIGSLLIASAIVLFYLRNRKKK